MREKPDPTGRGRGWTLKSQGMQLEPAETETDSICAVRMGSQKA